MTPVPVKPTSKLMIAVDALRRHMEDRKYAICNGCVYKKIDDSQFTFVYYGSIKYYILNSLDNSELANEIIPYVTPLIKLLSEPACRLIKPIKIDFNFIEVLPKGCCFNIKMKKFEMYPKMDGSPRAFVKYNYDVDRMPNPVIFTQGIFF